MLVHFHTFVSGRQLPVCAHVSLPLWGGTPTSRPNEAQLRFAVQRVDVALQLTHELLKAICGRWHSPLFPQPRRQQQMVAVKTLNIKQPPFILFSQVAIT